MEEQKAPPKTMIARTLYDSQRIKLEKLMKNPDKPIILPEKPKERGAPVVPDFVRNVMGSSAGAGSGEFHVYRHLRRKEYARQRFMTEKARWEKLEDEYHDKIDDNKRKCEEVTAKKRAKRLKRKQKMKTNKKGNKKSKIEESDDSGEESEVDRDEVGDLKPEGEDLKPEENDSNPKEDDLKPEEDDSKPKEDLNPETNDDNSMTENNQKGTEICEGISTCENKIEEIPTHPENIEIDDSKPKEDLNPETNDDNSMTENNQKGTEICEGISTCENKIEEIPTHHENIEINDSKPIEDLSVVMNDNKNLNDKNNDEEISEDTNK